ncbi:hypothetical protein [Yinghuangia soli]|uniref:TrbL/VirB6 plasmid conjugal transfer protein n=1 Tax=Yinghuangia soli TaxID=2908204 RepID=A0AA41PVN3_9ACTN|nr:hypothetical protein [Yinghuangia soli]MCF2526729.1 hypothetical protein [Yinghuangia soli]
MLRTIRPAAFATLLICVALTLIGLSGDPTGKDGHPQDTYEPVAAMAPADNPFGDEHEECEPLAGQDRYPWEGDLPTGSDYMGKAWDYCNEWYKKAGDKPPSLLESPDEWVIYYLNHTANTTYNWVWTSRDPVIGASGSSLQTKDDLAVAEANEDPFDFGRKHFYIFTITFSAVGVLISFILVARSGDPSAAQRAVRGPVYAMLAIGFTAPLVNANVKASDTFSKWILVKGVPKLGEQDPADKAMVPLSVEGVMRRFLNSFEEENFFLRALFLIGVIIAAIVLYFELIIRLFLVITGASLLPVMASLSGTNWGKEYLTRSIAVLLPLCYLDTFQAVGMVFPLRILAAHGTYAGSGTQQSFIALFGLIMVCLMPGALIRVAMPVASEVVSSGQMNRTLATVVPATGARVVTAWNAMRPKS